MFYNGFKYFQVFLQVSQMHVSNVSFVFKSMLHLLHLDVSKLDRCISLLVFLISRLDVRRGKTKPVPTSVGGPQCLRADVADEMRVGRRRTRDGGQRRG